MKPLVTSVPAIRELAAGLTDSAVESSPLLYLHSQSGAEYLIHSEDGTNAQRIVIIRESNTREFAVPELLSHARREVIGRMATFAERARILPLALPRPWHQYKYNNLVAFFAVPSGDPSSSRWIAEVISDGSSDVIFWAVTTGDAEVTLEDFEHNARVELPERNEWILELAAAKLHFDQQRENSSLDDGVELANRTRPVADGWSYDQWLSNISDDQRRFVHSPIEKSIRLRGPAGSGKTVSLVLKAIRESLAASDKAGDFRIAIVTHSWAMASQIDDLIQTMGLGPLSEIDTFPLLDIAKLLAPTAGSVVPEEYLVRGEDSQSGKQAQLDEISDVLADFHASNWITYRSSVSEEFRARIDSTDPEVRQALAWDLLIEFGSVIGASGIFPGAGSESRYLILDRATWMMPLVSNEDKRVVYHLYSLYMASLDARQIISVDQYLADFLNHLGTYAWNRARKLQGYDLVFVDEFHLFNPLERQVIHFLTRDTENYPRIFMAVDPRQSPSEAFIGLATTGVRTGQVATQVAEDDQVVTSYDLTTVHRFTPEILNLVKHIHHEFPTFELGSEWAIDMSQVESSAGTGEIPMIVKSVSRGDEETAMYEKIRAMYSDSRIAIAVVDPRQWGRFSSFAGSLAASRKFHVATIAGKSDIEGVGYRKRGVVIGPAEYLAGLQFDIVLVAGIPDMSSAAVSSNDRTRYLSYLYLAISRAREKVYIFVNEDDGGLIDVLQRALDRGRAQESRERN